MNESSSPVQTETEADTMELKTQGSGFASDIYSMKKMKP
jgi:hypothetical protein